MNTLHTFLLMVAFGIFSGLAAQDIIYRTDGTEIKAKVVEITLDAVKYRNFDQPTGPVRNLAITDVFMIIYEDGSKEVFKKPADKTAPDENMPAPAEAKTGLMGKTGKNSRVTFSGGAKAGVIFPLEDPIQEVYGTTLFHAEVDFDIWAHNGNGGGVGVGYTGREGTPITYGQVTNASAHITFIPIHVTYGYRFQNNPGVMPYFMTSLVITPFHEILEGDFYTGNGYEHLSNEASETAVGFNIIAGLQVKPAYIEAIFSYEKYKETNVGGFVVAAGFKF